jgi:hypothetical protein
MAKTPQRNRSGPSTKLFQRHREPSSGSTARSMSVVRSDIIANVFSE